MLSKLAPFCIASLALHIGLIAYLQKGRAPRPLLPVKPNKALVQTIYLKPEAPKPAPVKAVKVEAPSPKPKPQKAVQKVTKTAKKSPAPKPKPKAAKAKPQPPKITQGYAEEIAMQLKLLLSLPEYGAVKVGLVLNPTGSITKVEILDSQSLANEAYLREMLPKLTLPPPPNGETPLKLTLSNA